MIGYNEFGHPEFDTVRSPLGELVYRVIPRTIFSFSASPEPLLLRTLVPISTASAVTLARGCRQRETAKAKTACITNHLRVAVSASSSVYSDWRGRLIPPHSSFPQVLESKESFPPPVCQRCARFFGEGVSVWPEKPGKSWVADSAGGWCASSSVATARPTNGATTTEPSAALPDMPRPTLIRCCANAISAAKWKGADHAQ